MSDAPTNKLDVLIAIIEATTCITKARIEKTEETIAEKSLETLWLNTFTQMWIHVASRTRMIKHVENGPTE